MKIYLVIENIDSGIRSNQSAFFSEESAQQEKKRLIEETLKSYNYVPDIEVQEIEVNE